MLTEQYIELCKILVRNQRLCVKDLGYCIGWCGYKLSYDSLEEYDNDLLLRIMEWQKEGDLEKDMLPEEALREFLKDNNNEKS